MLFSKSAALALLLLSASPLSAGAAETPLPDAIAAPGETIVLTVHAEGAQVYECKAGVARERAPPIIAANRLWNSHYAGPTWELTDGSAVAGKVAASAPGATAKDIDWLRLDVASRRGSGMLSNVTTVQRINTIGGKLDDACDRPGDSRSMPYTADYVFLRKG